MKEPRREPDVEMDLSALTSVELWARFRPEGLDVVFDQEWEDYLSLFERIVLVDLPLV
jgi:hypothetical protein